MSDEFFALTLAGETLLLHPERAVIWPDRATVIVADTHFGKGQVFRRHGIAVPAGSDDHDRERLTGLVRSTGARHLIILGDFLHAPLDAASRDARDLETWSESLRPAEIHVVAGNHDRGAIHRWRPPFDWLENDRVETPFRFTHDADRASRCDQGLFTLSGHVHPVVRLQGLRKQGPRIPVFWLRSNGLVLPSFGLFTGGYAVTPQPGERLFAVGPQRVVAFR